MSFIESRQARDFPAGLVPRVLGIAESTYYDWLARRMFPSRRELDDAVLEQILKDPLGQQHRTPSNIPRTTA